MRIEDEYGRTWKVNGGDPAAKLVNGLKRRLPGLDFVVLPWYDLATGSISEPAAYPGDLLSRTRLLDCLDVLKGAA